MNAVRRTAILLSLTLTLGACVTTPPISCGRSCSDEQLTAKLQQRFPLGSPSAGLVAELHREGFRVQPERGTATFTGHVWPCDIDTYVKWSEAEGRLTALSGLTGEACF